MSLKKYFSIAGVIASVLVSFLFLILNYKRALAAENLILNPSFELSVASSTLPANWNEDAWGVNQPSFIYKSEGYNSSSSVYVSISNRKSGDAKWYFDPVNVQPDTEYAYTDYFKANIASRIVVMSLDATGNETYFDVGAIASSSSWKRVAFSFKTLPNTSRISVFHLIQKNGWLQIDDASLMKIEPALITDNVPNNSMETLSLINPNLPQSWKRAKWGTNTATYGYLKNGHDGARSVRVNVSNYISGDAKWIYEPQPVESGKDYKFTAWYKTNTLPHVVAWFTLEDGSEKYFGMPDPEPQGTGWQLYSDVFNVPQDAKKVSVFFFLTSNGWVQTDDYHVLPYSYTGFDEGIVSLTFDDGFERNASTVLPVVKQYGFKITQCAASQYLEGQPEQEAYLKTFINEGQDICSHSVTHPDLTQISSSSLDYELQHSKEYLEQNFASSSEFASPYGIYNSNVLDQIKKYYSSHRTVNEGYNSKDNFDPYRLRVQNANLNTTVSEFENWINKAKNEKLWLIIVYHAIDNKNLGEFDTLKTTFDSQMEKLNLAGVNVKSWGETLKLISQ